MEARQMAGRALSKGRFILQRGAEGSLNSASQPPLRLAVAVRLGGWGVSVPLVLVLLHNLTQAAPPPAWGLQRVLRQGMVEGRLGAAPHLPACSLPCRQ